MTDAKTEKTRAKYRKRLIYQTPIEFMGSFGFIPFYRDVKGVQNTIMFNTVEQAEQQAKKDGLSENDKMRLRLLK